MKFTPEVIAAIETLRKNVENDFELHRISVLEKDLTAPPVVEVIDEKHQKFDGVIYRKDNGGHYSANTSIHRAVYKYYCGEILKAFHIHHKDFDKSNNIINNLEMLSNSAHQRVHHITPNEKIKCKICGRLFIPNEKRVARKQTCCSLSCASKCRAKIINEKSCPQCGKNFKLKRKHQKFCSRTCFMKNRWQNKKSP